MTATVAEIDILDPALYRHGFPHDLFAELRDGHPVRRHVPTTVASRTAVQHGENTEMAFWCVLGHPEIQRVNRDWHAFSANRGPTIWRQAEGGGAGILGMDPPEHHRLRHLVSAGFTPRMIGRLEERIEYWVDRLLAEALADGDEIEMVADLAWPLPMHVIADIIGIPEADRPWVFDRTALVLDGLDVTKADEAEAQQVGMAELFGYAHDLGAEKRRNPADDVWSTLIAAHYADEDGATSQLDEAEVDIFFLILSIAGSETTRTALSSGLVGLLQHPDQITRLRNDADLRATMPDEILRWSSPVLSFGRECVQEAEVAGVVIEPGERVVMFHPVGNRDPRVFDEPDRIDLGRDPNPHVAFGGGGPHYCLGANLAKKEIQVLFRELVARFPTIEQLAEPTWIGPGPSSNVGCHVDTLPVRLA